MVQAAIYVLSHNRVGLTNLRFVSGYTVASGNALISLHWDYRPWADLNVDIDRLSMSGVTGTNTSLIELTGRTFVTCVCAGPFGGDCPFVTVAVVG